MTGHQIGYIARTALPMFLIMVVMVAILVIWPELATWLPGNRTPGHPPDRWRTVTTTAQCP